MKKLTTGEQSSDEIPDYFRNDDNAIILLNNGKEYGFYFGSNGFSSYFDETDHTTVFEFDSFSEYFEIDPVTKEKVQNNSKITVIDPKNISKIIINGDTVYSA